MAQYSRNKAQVASLPGSGPPTPETALEDRDGRNAVFAK